MSNNPIPLEGLDTGDFKVVYQELCASYHAIDDFRTKLLGLLPLASGVGIFVLLNDTFTSGILNPSLPEDKDLAVRTLFPIGLFGFIVTFGLLINEYRCIRQCLCLIELGKAIEVKMNTAGQFYHYPSDSAGVLGKPIAAFIIYSAVPAAWIYLAFVFVLVPQAARVVSIIVFVGGVLLSYVLYRTRLIVNPKEDKSFAKLVDTQYL